MAQKGVSTTAAPLESSDYYRLIKCLEADKQYRWALFCVIACTMALRASDVLRLTWCDILNGDILFIQEKKTTKTRRIAINSSTRAKFQKLYKLMGSPDKDQLIFISKRTGQAYTIQNVNYHLREFKKRYELPIDRFSTHSFRKTFGKKVYEDNNKTEHGLLIVNRTLGHNQVQTTARYIGLKPQEFDGVYDSFQFI